MGRGELFPALLKDISGIYVEIGTCWGGFAEFLCQNTGLTHLCCVDPYKVFPNHIYFDSLNFQTQEQLDKKFQVVAQRLSKFPVSILRTTSYEASKLLPNNLAFVYIDGNHHHREVLKDLIVWWPKIKKGGYLCGDDVEDITKKHTDGDLLIEHEGKAFGLYGVATALEDFAKVVPDFRYRVEGNQFIAQKL